MAGETTNVAKMAEIVADEIFSFFGWETRGPANENFPCVKIEKHQKSSHPHHPVDAVFRYEEPYKKGATYVLTDFKSYAKGSLTKASITGSLRDLSKSLDCAYVEESFHDRYINDSDRYDIVGMLFIFNHDNDFDSDFNKLYYDLSPETLTIPRDSKIFIFGPDRIKYILSIISDAKSLIADEKLSRNKKDKFLYPDRVLHYTRKQNFPYTTLEYLLGPIIILPYSFPEKEIFGFVIYYDGTGESVEEFQILFDYLLRNQLVQDGSHIDIRMLNACKNFQSNFEKAKINFLDSLWGLNEIEQRLTQIRASRINRTITTFNNLEIGMERRKSQ